MAKAYIGTSGWNYKNWKPAFFGKTPQREWLRFCAERFSGIEINGTHYRLQSQETFRRWYDATPDSFRFAMKGHRYLTHHKKLKDPRDSLNLSHERASALGEKLAAVLWQLPGSFRKEIERLQGFADCLASDWGDARHAVEFRHDSWFDPETEACLGHFGIAVCQSDAADWPLWDAVTTDMVYVRLHGHTRTYASAYSDEMLDQWAGRVRTWLGEGRDVHVYFDNDSEGAAPFDALRLLDRI